MDMVDTFVTFAQYELRLALCSNCFTRGMNTIYLWDLKAGSFMGCSAIMLSRAGLDMVLGEEKPSFARNQAPFIQLMASNSTDPLPTVGLCS